MSGGGPIAAAAATTESVQGVEAAENPADLLVAALESPEVTDEELEAVDASLDVMMLQETGPGLNSGKPLLTIEEAQAKLSPEILEVLSKKFKGSLTQTRHLDARDQIF
jgi:hypothetical protein